MSTSIFILLVVQIILIILNAIFASAEIAVLSMNETKRPNIINSKKAKVC